MTSLRDEDIQFGHWDPVARCLRGRQRVEFGRADQHGARRGERTTPSARSSLSSRVSARGTCAASRFSKPTSPPASDEAWFCRATGVDVTNGQHHTSGFCNQFPETHVAANSANTYEPGVIVSNAVPEARPSVIPSDGVRGRNTGLQERSRRDGVLTSLRNRQPVSTRKSSRASRTRKTFAPLPAGYITSAYTPPS